MGRVSAGAGNLPGTRPPSLLQPLQPAPHLQVISARPMAGERTAWVGTSPKDNAGTSTACSHAGKGAQEPPGAPSAELPGCPGTSPRAPARGSDICLSRSEVLTGERRS